VRLSAHTQPGMWMPVLAGDDADITSPYIDLLQI
jgi:hypothetical protein